MHNMEKITLLKLFIYYGNKNHTDICGSRTHRKVVEHEDVQLVSL